MTNFHNIKKVKYNLIFTVTEVYGFIETKDY